MDIDEIEQAFADYQTTVARIAQTGEWARFADMFTADATYEEHAYGTFNGREEIRGWVVETMTAFPGNTMSSFPIAWHVVDTTTDPSEIKHDFGIMFLDSAWLIDITIYLPGVPETLTEEEQQQVIDSLLASFKTDLD